MCRRCGGTQFPGKCVKPLLEPLPRPVARPSSMRLGSDFPATAPRSVAARAATTRFPFDLNQVQRVRQLQLQPKQQQQGQQHEQQQQQQHQQRQWPVPCARVRPCVHARASAAGAQQPSAEEGPSPLVATLIRISSIATTLFPCACTQQSVLAPYDLCLPARRALHTHMFAASIKESTP